MDSSQNNSQLNIAAIDMIEVDAVDKHTEVISTLTTAPFTAGSGSMTANIGNRSFVPVWPSPSCSHNSCDTVTMDCTGTSSTTKSNSGEKVSIMNRLLRDPDYPKTTFHLEVAQLLVTNTATTSNFFPCVPSVSDLLELNESPQSHQDSSKHVPNPLETRLLSLSAVSNKSNPPFTRLTIEREILRLTHASDILNASHSSEEDLYSLCLAMERLQLSGWYYKNVSRQQVKYLLKDSVIGSFLVRDSTDPGHLFALSVRTPRGTTNVRIEYDNGQFRLDCEDCLRIHMPVFSCIVKLVNFYIRMGRDEEVNNPCVWLETSGRRDMPVKLTLPLRQELPSLKHLSRLTICGRLPVDLPIIQKQSTLIDSIERLPLPNPLIHYLKQYPYAC